MSVQEYEVELFEIDKNSALEALTNLQAYKCEFSFSPNAQRLFSSDADRAYHVSTLLRMEGLESFVLNAYDKPELIIFGRPRENYLGAFKIPDEEYSITINAVEMAELRDKGVDNFPVNRYQLDKALRTRITPPLSITGHIVFDSSADIGEQIPIRRSNKLLEPIAVYLGFSYYFRTLRERYFLQIMPQSRLVYTRTIADLIQSGKTNAEIESTFPYVESDGLGKGRLAEITELSIDDTLTEEPFNGRTFRNFANAMYPSKAIGDKNTKLARFIDGRLPYYPVSWLRPSLTFRSISYLSDIFYSQLISTLKTQGKNRSAASKAWARRMNPLKIGDNEVRISLVPHSVPVDKSHFEIEDLDKLSIRSIGHIFHAPSINLLRDGKPVEIFPRLSPYQGTVNDLLKHSELKPLDVPKELNVIVFVHHNLTSGWIAIRDSLVQGRGDYRGFKSTFGCDIKIKEVVISDFQGEFAERASQLPEDSYDCALIIIPRYLETSDETSRIYVSTKTAIMNRGIPVQVFTDDQKMTYGRNTTLVGKAQNAFTVFGLAINILAKSGAILTSLSESATSKLLPNSMILGYNIARVVPSNVKGVKTIPLAAPLVIFDSRGAYISHQDVYRPRSEVSLFQDHGDKIFSNIPSDISTLVIHKDGYFSRTEIETITQLGERHGVRTVPISITTGNVPRVFNPSYFNSDVGLDAGMVLPLSDSDFLMVTTPIKSWDPSRLGWPNPIQITFHDYIDDSEQAKLLYHIFALTKMQTGSQRPTRTPISIHFSNMITRFLRKAGDPTPPYLRHFVRPREGGKYLPRWFV